MKICFKPVWISWTLNGCRKPLRLKARRMSPPAPLMPPNDNVSGRAAWTGPSCHWKQNQSPHMLCSQGLCKCQPSRCYFEWQSYLVWGLDIENSFGQTHVKPTAHEVLSWKPTFSFVGEWDHTGKEARKKRERKKLIHDSESSSTRTLVGFSL